MAKTRKIQRENRGRSISSSNSSSDHSRDSSFSDRSGNYRRSRSHHVDRYYEKRPDMRMYSLYQPGFGSMPMGNGYPMQAGIIPGGMMSQMPNGLMAQYGTPMPNVMQPTMYPCQTGMMGWPYQTTQFGQPSQMQPVTHATPVFQFQILPGKNILSRK